MEGSSQVSKDGHTHTRLASLVAGGCTPSHVPLNRTCAHDTQGLTNEGHSLMHSLRKTRRATS